ncbi:hypothetical protein HYALB_00011809 [Hymenoscyphus albidus]|uniref:Modin n=1 Tax=Hymenoscyphus albidus TaxID=595503 RepID=A0A9N9Q847_9HELO|nr:hypothetical protein HYALB_00011809 [Hymenoscyphus albidus]
MDAQTNTLSSKPLDVAAITSIVALVISITALVATTIQVLQQYFASATGYSSRSGKVIGLCANTTKRVFRPSELRFEVQFEAPVLFVAPLTNKNKPVKKRDLFYCNGTNISYMQTRTLLPDIETSNIIALREDVHTADNERASWLNLLSAVQKMERESRNWENLQWSTTGRTKLPDYVSTFAVAVQPKTRSWDAMQDIRKPYATSTIYHIVEIAAALGIYWQEFDRKWHQYRAEGNGYILSGSNTNSLGIVFTFDRTGRKKFEENRLIPLDEVKELCFGFVPTIFRLNPSGALEAPPILDKMKQGDMPTLQLGSRHEIAETLVLIGCDTTTVQHFLDERSKTKHLFHIPFEIMGMLAKPLHIKGSCFRMLPNPTVFHWNRKSFSLRELLTAFHHRLRKETNTVLNSVLVRLLERDEVENASQKDDSLPPMLLDALHEAINKIDSYLLDDHTPQSRIIDVLWRHIQVVLCKINQNGADGDSEFDALNHTRPTDREKDFIRIYFEVIRSSVVKSGERQLWSDGSEASEQRHSGDNLPPDITNERNSIWCMLVLRMLCWLTLHDFSKKDVQIPKSELLGCRLPVYIV